MMSEKIAATVSRGCSNAPILAAQRSLQLPVCRYRCPSHGRSPPLSPAPGIKENVQRVQEYVAREEAHAIKVFQRENPILKPAARKEYPPHMRSSNATLW